MSANYSNQELSNEIESKYKDTNCQAIMNSVGKKFTSILSSEELNGCKYRALWKAIKGFDESKNVKFLTYLHKGMYLECRTTATKIAKNKVKSVDPNDLRNYPDKNFNKEIDFTDLKNIQYGELLIDLYVERLKISEIMEKYNIDRNEFMKRKKAVLKELRLKMS